MTYGKLINNVIEYAPYHLVKDGVDILGYNFDSNFEMLLVDGYKPVELINDKTKYQNDNTGEYIFTFEEQSDKIVEVAKFNKYSDEVLAEKIRQKRDEFLDITDKFMISDYPITELEREDMKVYRQYLRDLPESENFPNVEVLDFNDWRQRTQIG